MAHYNDFKSFIQTNFEDYLKKELTRFINENHDGLGFHSFNVLSICRQEVDNLEVKSIRCSDDIGPFIKVDVTLTADIILLGLGTKKYEADRKKRWFTVHIVARIGNSMVIAEDRTWIEEYSSGKFDKATSLDEFLVPYVYSTDLEEIADDFTLFYCQDALYNGYRFPYEHVFQAMELNAYEADLPEKNMGRMYFREDRVSFYRRYPYIGERMCENEVVPPGTMLISRNHRFMNNAGSTLLTIAHEIVHWYYHQKFFEILKLLNNDEHMMSCDVEPQLYDEDMSAYQKARWFVEWQANAIGMRIAMPRDLFTQAMQEAYATAEQIPRMGSFEAEVLEDTIRRVAALFDVSPFVAKQRAIQLGWDVAAGTFIFIDGHYHKPFIFKQGILNSRQTFVISKTGLSKVCRENKKIADLLISKKFIYLGYVVCLNDEQYIERNSNNINESSGFEYDLTDYGRNHVDECCLVFNWDSISGVTDDGGFYGQCYLSQDVSAYNRIEHSYDYDFENNQDVVSLAEEIAKYKAAFAEEDNVLRELPGEFSETLYYHMKRKKVTVEELSFRSKLSSTTIKNYRSGRSNPELDNIMAVCIGLNLPEKYCDHMLDTVGMALTDKNLKQKVYRILIREYSDGTIDQWNEILKCFNLGLIPNIKNQKNDW